MQMAISAIKNEKPQSKWEAASVFGVSEATLHNQLKGMKSWSETRASGHKLTDFEEEALVKQLLDAGKQDFSIWSQYLHEIVAI